MDINASIISSQGLSDLQNISDNEISDYFKFLGHDDIESLAVANGVSLLPYSNWGEDFLVLADITGGEKQNSDECLGFANDYAESIMKHNNNSYGKDPKFYSSMDQQEVLQIAKSEITQGRPVVFEVEGTTPSNQEPVTIPMIVNGEYKEEKVLDINRHYVVVYGIKKDADPNNLKQSDFLYLDPAGGQVKQLNTTNGGSQQRDLLNGQRAKTHEDDEFYCVNVFSDVDYSQEFTNTEKIERIMDQPVGINGKNRPIVYYSNA